MTVLYDAICEEPPAADRLRAMINTLASGAEIDADMRTEIIDALKRHEVKRRNDELRTRGNDIAYGTWYAATIAKELIDHHGARTVKAAVWAAAESLKWQMGLDPKSVTIQEHANIKRAYQKINKSADGYIVTGGGKFRVAQITPAWMEDAVARLNGKPGSGATPVDAHGVIAILSAPLSKQAPRNK